MPSYTVHSFLILLPVVLAAALFCCCFLRPVESCSFFVSNFNASQPDNGTTLAKANYFNRFRGPDATNIEYIRGWTFVHNLLSMTGTFTLQPFVSEDGNAVVLFNGEVYNYRSLAEELVGDENAFESDGFSLLQAYQKWGTDFVSHLHGEFAIVLVDFASQLALLSTDVFSTKPLWYAKWRCENAVATGSWCFAASSYESVLKGIGVPSADRKMANPNEVLVIEIGEKPTRSSEFAVQARKTVFEFDLKQYKNHTEDWEKAFVEAVRLRTEWIKHKVFIGLSSGFDSGAIMLALDILKRPFFAYNVVTEKDSASIIQERANFVSYGTSVILQMNKHDFDEEYRWLSSHCEKFKYLHHQEAGVEYSYDDKASVGLSYIFRRVRKQGGLIYISGSGADETISDYGMNGQKIFQHSCFGGRFPNDLGTIFPWCSFYLGTQRSYLMKEEVTGGAHGIETRYPFLDPHVVQEYLWLSADVKNSEYKRPIADFLRKSNFPNLYGEKAGFGVKTTVESSDVKEYEYKGPSAGFLSKSELPNLYGENAGLGVRVMWITVFILIGLIASRVFCYRYLRC